MTDTIEEQISRYKRKTAVLFTGIFMIMFFCMIGIFLYYELKIRSVTGGLYLVNENAASSLLDVLFRERIGTNNLIAAEHAVKAAGYTENGFVYLFMNGGQKVLLLIVFAVFAGCAVTAGWWIRRIDRADIYARIHRITEEKQLLERKLISNVKYVEKRNTQLQDFIENIAHQVKTSLAGLALALDVAKENLQSVQENRKSKLSRETAVQVSEINSELEECFFHIERIKAFIMRLLKISRMEAGKVIFTQNEINVKELLQEAVTTASVNEQAVEIHELPDDYRVDGDNEWLLEAFVNIINNAAEFIRDKKDGKIKIGAKCLPEKCIITICDNGPGFQPEIIEKLFDRFETQRSSKFFHVGIGLNLSKLIIEAHHGTVQAENHPSGGACFRIVIPRFLLKKGKIMSNM